MLEEIKSLKQAKSKRIFITISILALILELIILWWIDHNKLAEHYIYYQVSKEVLLNVIATTFTAIIIVLIIAYLLPSEIRDIDIEILDPDRTRKEHLTTLNKSTFWHHNGHLGRWVRTKAMPFLSQKSIANSIPTRASLIILNPKNDKVCEAYLKYRLGMAFKENNVENIDDVKAELVATVVCAQLYHQDQSSLKVSVFLNNQLTLVREDINSCAVFRTHVNPRSNCIAYYNKNQGDYSSDFYNTANTNFESVSTFCEPVEMKTPIDIRDKKELSIEKLKAFLSKNNLLISENRTFLSNVLKRVISDYNPYN